MSTPLYQSIYIALALGTPKGGSPPQHSNISILRDFPTCLAAYGVDSTNTSYPIISVQWTLNKAPVPTMQNGQVQVTSSTVGTVMTLAATYEGLTSSVQLTVEESDLLIYAPDGNVYRVHKDIWASQVYVVPQQELSPIVQTQLAREVPVADIPSSPNTTSAALGEPSENITCFLLNLNSILQSPPSPALASSSSSKTPGNSNG